MEGVPDVEVDDNTDWPGLTDVYDDVQHGDDERKEPGKPYTGEDELKDGDCIFVATIPCEAEFTSNWFPV